MLSRSEFMRAKECTQHVHTIAQTCNVQVSVHWMAAWHHSWIHLIKGTKDTILAPITESESSFFATLILHSHVVPIPWHKSSVTKY